MAFEKTFEETLINISMSDIVTHPWYERLSKEPNGLEALLYTMGLDIKLPYEVMVCEHRSSMTNQVHTCERWSGIERQDEIWESIKRRIREV